MVAHLPGPGSNDDDGLPWGGKTTLIATQKHALAPPDEASVRRYLLVFEGSSSWLYELPLSGETVIGRQDGVALHLADPSVSRRHARIVTVAGAAQVADLGSQNGTQVNGEAIVGERPLASGDVITVCSASLVYYSSAPKAAARQAEEPARFRRRLEEELERALRYRRACTVVSALGVGPADRPLAAEALQAELRAVDHFAFLGASGLCLLLPEIGADEAPREAGRLVAALRAVSPGVRAGFATCPGDGGDVDAVLAAAREAAVASTPGVAVGAAAARGTRTFGDRTVDVADPAMSHVWGLLERLAVGVMPVLVWGETGTGKELAAEAVHAWSPRRDHRFVAVNVAAVPESLFESELFGHAKGAFTGAIVAKPGLIEAAQGGTLFLDEIGELGLAVQAKLLRVIETRRVRRVGEHEDRPVDVRFVAATSRNLSVEVEAGRFRKDLYFRLNAASVWLPPLRDRRRELPLLARQLCAEACARAGRPPMVISDWAMRTLASHPFPGNVRELKNLLDVLATTVNEPVLEPWHVTERLRESGGTEAPPELPPSGREAAGDAAGKATGEATSDAATRTFRPIEEEVAELERRRMAEALEAAGGNQTRAAELIRMPLRTFQTKVRLYDLRGNGRRRG